MTGKRFEVAIVGGHPQLIYGSRFLIRKEFIFGGDSGKAPHSPSSAANSRYPTILRKRPANRNLFSEESSHSVKSSKGNAW